MLAALDLNTGKLLYRIRARKRCIEFLDLLTALRARWPGEKLYVVCDNFSPHHHAQVKAWCAANALELVFLPTYGSWLNQGCVTGHQWNRHSFERPRPNCHTHPPELRRDRP